MSGVLYIVATPIGNLGDISLRAIDTLKQVDLIAAEDTRHSTRLLNHLGISKKLISLHEHNEHSRVASMLEKLLAGMDIALISDAGTPLISDPGYTLVKAVTEAGIKVCPVPGASSIIAALSGSGLATDKFTYFGFLPQKNVERVARLNKMKDQRGTLILLESSHRIERLLEQLADVLPSNLIVVAKELTKLHEQFLRGKAVELIEKFKQDAALCKGEFVVLIDNPATSGEGSNEQDDIKLLELLLAELPLKKAVQLATRISGKKKNYLYRLALDINAVPDRGPA
ncbi:MAG: 16S rRNA (cytidine(1402)-2'-O)-methyltransferase [Gammaproteobacteria bacterium]|nr:MAG: 16S rRNA (cytidine(1402)-2'-O)-methyltransferase [Gammaproteobacteria bacterium]